MHATARFAVGELEASRPAARHAGGTTRFRRPAGWLWQRALVGGDGDDGERLSRRRTPGGPAGRSACAGAVRLYVRRTGLGEDAQARVVLEGRRRRSSRRSLRGSTVTVTPVAAGTATATVTATDPLGLSALRAFRVTVTAAATGSFTDDPLVPGETPVRAVHFTELRTRIDALRATAGLPRFAWTDAILGVGVTPVRLVHLLELRSALAEVYAAAGRSLHPRYAALHGRVAAGGDDSDPGGAPAGAARRGGGAGMMKLSQWTCECRGPATEVAGGEPHEPGSHHADGTTVHAA